MKLNKTLVFAISLTFLWGAKPNNINENVESLPAGIHKAMAAVERTIWDGNQISTWHSNNGNIVDHHLTGNAGLEWPKGGGKTAVFCSGLWLASGKSREPGGDWEEEIRTAAAEYTVEFVPGTIDGESGHIYEIHRVELEAFLNNDYATYSQMSAEIPVTIVDERVTITVQFPTDDFKNWPVDHGAPWVDANGDGEYNIEDGDYPDILGDQFHWYVMNDGDAAIHTPLWGTVPMRVEIQTSVFGYNQAGALGNILFTRWVIINKGSTELDSVFVSIWHDDDVGDAEDDFVGCDTSKSLGYTYNEGEDSHYGVEVPAVGADFFQGPLVQSAGDSASILTWSADSSYYVREVLGYKMLPLTSFAKYINGDPLYQDPETSEEAYRYMNGLVGLTGEPFVDPTTGEPSVFVHPGDPVAGTGWIDYDSGDRRYLMTSGPFYLGPGDIQEVVGCIIIAGGSNWAKSITKLKYFDDFAQAAFNVNFDVCSPPIPSVSVAQLDEKIVLTFQEGSQSIEGYSCADYTFEGYNIYQGESLNGPWTRIGTYDIVNNVKVILDLVLDEETGELIEVPAQFGTDSGLDHQFQIEYDKVRGSGLINGRKYYFSVTAYAYDPEAAQRVIESPIEAIIAIPMEPGLGADLAATSNDTIDVEHTSGIAGASVVVQVVDPYQLTNDDYEVFFEYDSVSEENSWSLVNITDYDTVISNETRLLKESINITDGFILTFSDATFEAPTTSNRTVQTVDADSDTNTQILYSEDKGIWADFMGGYGFTGGTNDKSLLQKDIRFVFTDEPQKGYYWNGAAPNLEMKDVPFEVWTVEDSVRINVMAWILTGGKDVVYYEDYEIDPGTGDTLSTFGRFWNHQIVPIYEPYDTTASYTAWDEGSESLGWIMVYNKDDTKFIAGDEFEVGFNNPIFPDVDEYEFTISGMTTASSDKIDSQLDAINVFPNPYFGQYMEERNPQNRQVIFTHLGVGSHTIRIFTLAGDLVRKIEQENVSENDVDNLIIWDLRNDWGIPVASGMYIAHIETPYGEKILKLAVILPEERLDVY